MTKKEYWIEKAKKLSNEGYVSVNCYLVKERDHEPHVLSKLSMEFCEGVFHA